MTEKNPLEDPQTARTSHALQRLHQKFGTRRLADAIGCTVSQYYHWMRSGEMPYTEYTGETTYASQLALLYPDLVTLSELLPARPHYPDQIIIDRNHLTTWQRICLAAMGVA